MKSKHSIRYLIESRTWVSDLWGQISCSRVTFNRYLEIREQVFARFPKSVPAHVREAARNYEQAFYDMHTRKMLWAHEYAGKAYFGWDALPEAGKQLFRDNKGRSAHVWPGPECVSGTPFSSLRLWGELSA